MLRVEENRLHLCDGVLPTPFPGIIRSWTPINSELEHMSSLTSVCPLLNSVVTSFPSTATTSLYLLACSQAASFPSSLLQFIFIAMRTVPIDNSRPTRSDMQVEGDRPLCAFLGRFNPCSVARCAWPRPHIVARSSRPSSEANSVPASRNLWTSIRSSRTGNFCRMASVSLWAESAERTENHSKNPLKLWGDVFCVASLEATRLLDGVWSMFVEDIFCCAVGVTLFRDVILVSPRPFW